MIYFTADTHFNHSFIIKSCARPFANITQMNNALIDNWNSCVKDDDDIYILGDLAFEEDGTVINNLVERLNGKKYLIKGNHDEFIDNKDFVTTNFVWIKDYYVLNYAKRKIVLFHYPIFEWECYYSDGIHLYGHVHNCWNNKDEQARLKLLGKRAINVGVDVNNYHPISIERILKMAE